MAGTLIQAIPNIGSTVTLVDGSTNYGDQAILMDEAELGFPVWDHQFSGPRGTQGALPASGTPQNRQLILPFRVYGTSKDDLATNISALETVAENLRRFGGRIKFKSVDQTNAQYYDVMVGSFDLRKWGGRAEVNNKAEFVLSCMCGPYLLGDALTTMAFTSQTFPAVVQLGTTITGDVPALVDVSVTTSGGTDAPVWALLGWTERPASPLSSSVAPFGIIEAESAIELVNWANTVTSASDRGGSALRYNTAGAATMSGAWLVDPSVLTPDDYARGEVAVEVWARVYMDSTLVSPKLTLSVKPEDGTSFGAERFTDEWGSAGKLLTKPSSAGRRFVRLGTVRMVVDRTTPRRWKLALTGTVAAGSSGHLSPDYLVLVPAKKRALSPTGKALDSSFPKFIASTSNTTKRVRSDLSGRVNSGAYAAANQHPDQGLGGSLLEIPPGTVDFLVKLSSLVPDDPTSDATTEQVSHTSAAVRFDVVPRWAYLRV